jgi:hypothetical protein
MKLRFRSFGAPQKKQKEFADMVGSPNPTYHGLTRHIAKRLKKQISFGDMIYATGFDCIAARLCRNWG